MNVIIANIIGTAAGIVKSCGYFRKKKEGIIFIKSEGHKATIHLTTKVAR